MRISITTTLAAGLLASLSAGVNGFVSQLPASRARPLQRRGSLSMSDSSVQDKATQVGNTLLGYVTGAVEAAKNLDSDKAQDQLSEWGKKVSGNVVDSLDLQKEGELYALPPLLLMLLILYGHVPFVGPIAELLAGPGLVAVGATFFAAGAVCVLPASHKRLSSYSTPRVHMPFSHPACLIHPPTPPPQS
jgi:hypothetical protein